MTAQADDPTIAHYLKHFDEAMVGGGMPEAQRLMLRQTVASYLSQLDPASMPTREGIKAQWSQFGTNVQAVSPQIWVSQVYGGQGVGTPTAAGTGSAPIADQGIGAQLMSSQTMGGQLMGDGPIGTPFMGQELDGTPIEPLSSGIGRIVLISVAVVVIVVGLLAVGRFLLFG